MKNNATVDSIGHFDHEIDKAGVMVPPGSFGHFDNEIDKLKNNAIVGNTGHLDNEIDKIDKSGVGSLPGIKVDNIFEPAPPLLSEQKLAWADVDFESDAEAQLQMEKLVFRMLRVANPDLVEGIAVFESRLLQVREQLRAE